MAPILWKQGLETVEAAREYAAGNDLTKIKGIAEKTAAQIEKRLGFPKVMANGLLNM